MKHIFCCLFLSKETFHRAFITSVIFIFKCKVKYDTRWEWKTWEWTIENEQPSSSLPFPTPSPTPYSVRTIIGSLPPPSPPLPPPPKTLWLNSLFYVPNIRLHFFFRALAAFLCSKYKTAPFLQGPCRSY